MTDKIVKGLIVQATVLFLDAFLVMLLAGGLHTHYPQVPPIGWWWAVAVVATFQALIRGATA